MVSIFGDDNVDDLFDNNVDEDEENEKENDELPGDENLFGEDPENNGEDKNEAGTAVKVEPKKRSVRNPRPRLTIDTLTGPRGIQTIEEYFKDVKFKGKGYEKQDLDEILRRLQHWGHRMYPTYTFEDVLNNIERLGKKKQLQVHMSRYRLNMLESMKRPEEIVDDDYENMDGDAALDEPYDEFDALLGEQIAISKLAPRTPAHSSYSDSYPNTPAKTNSTFASPSFHRNHMAMSTPYSNMGDGGGGSGGDGDGGGGPSNLHDLSDYGQPLPDSQPPSPMKKQLNAEQMARIAENRRLAQERLRAKQKQQQNETIIEE